MRNKLLILLLTGVSINPSQASSVNVSETQRDEVQCETLKDQEGKKYKSCGLITSGGYTVTAKLAASIFLDAGIYLPDVTGDTPLSITLGNFSFDGTLNTANKRKLTLKSLQGTWLKRHDACMNPKASICAKYKRGDRSDSEY